MKSSPLAVLLTAALALGGVLATALPATAVQPRTAPLEITVGDFEFRSDGGDPATATLAGYVGTATDVTIPATVTLDGTEHTVTTIGTEAFMGRGLTSIHLPDTIVTVEYGAFMWNQLTSVTIPDSVVTIGDEAFSQSPLTQVTIGSSVQSLGEFAFEHYDYGTETILPLDVTFTGSPPTSVVEGGPWAFGSFAEIENVTISFPKQYDATVYDGGYTRPLWYGYPTQGTVSVAFDLGAAGGTMPAMRAAEGSAFTAPDAPERDGFEFTGWYVDEALHTPFDSAAPVAADLTLYADWDRIALLTFQTIGDVIYLVDVHDEDAEASAVGPAEGFRGKALTIAPEVEIEGTTYPVTSIGPHSFDGMGLTSVSIPNSIVTIEEYAFAAGDIDGQQLTHRNPLGDLVIPDSVVTIGDYAFAGATLTSLRLGSGIRDIGEAAFIDASLTALTLPDGLVTIGQFAFDMNRLTSIVIPDSVTHIDFMAFAGSPLAAVRLGSSVESIGALAFSPDSMMLTRASAPRSMVVTFTGPAPATFTPAGYNGSFGYADGVLVQYPVGFETQMMRASGGFTSPTWQGYASVALATVTFDLGGHGSSISPLSVPVGSLLSSLPTPTASGWTFTGWFLDAALTQPAGPLTAVTADTSLFAGWQQVVVPTDPDSQNPGSAETEDADREGSLASTGGTDITTFSAFALALIALGVVAVFTRRRSRSAS